jgi:hypothetical protein
MALTVITKDDIYQNKCQNIGTYHIYSQHNDNSINSLSITVHTIMTKHQNNYHNDWNDTIMTFNNDT